MADARKHVNMRKHVERLQRELQVMTDRLQKCQWAAKEVVLAQGNGTLKSGLEGIDLEGVLADAEKTSSQLLPLIQSALATAPWDKPAEADAPVQEVQEQVTED